MSTRSDQPRPSTEIVAVDVAIIGAGPAGCSCALWLQQLGLRCALIDQAPEPCQSLRGLHFHQNWVLGQPQTSLHELAEQYAQHVRALPGLVLRLGSAIAQVRSSGDDSVHIDTADGQRVSARALVLATGLRPRQAGTVFREAGFVPLDALTLTRQRDQLRRGRVLLLGGGDNAVENALYLHDRGHQVTLWSRAALRAAPPFVRALQDRTGIVQRIGHAMPTAFKTDGQGIGVHSLEHGTEHFDVVAALFGFEPDLRLLAQFVPAQSRAQLRPNVFLAGDVSERLHPSIVSAQADGVDCAKQVQRWLQQAPREPRPAQTQAARILSLTGLRFDANLGILEHEKLAPQPIQVDAELHLGQQALLPRDDDIHHVLDYRKIRKIIIDECTAEHVNLLESLIGKLSARLLQLPGVVGVRVKIAKLSIFDDCEVAIRAEVGHW